MTLLACRVFGRYGGGHSWKSLLQPCTPSLDDWGKRVWRKLNQLKHPRDNRPLQSPTPLAAVRGHRLAASSAAQQAAELGDPGPEEDPSNQADAGTDTGTVRIPAGLKAQHTPGVSSHAPGTGNTRDLQCCNAPGCHQRHAAPSAGPATKERRIRRASKYPG